MLHDFSPLFKNRQFFYLWLNQALSQVSYNLLNFTLLILVYKLTGSTFAVSIMIIFFYLPPLIFSLPAGVISDLADKRKVMIITDILWAGSVLLIFLTKDHFWGLLFFTFLAKFFDTFFFPSEAASLPVIVKSENLTQANSSFSLNTYLGMIVGFLLAGPMIRFIGSGSPLILAALLTIIGAVAVFFMDPIKGEGMSKKFNLFHSLETLKIKLSEGVDFFKLQLKVLSAIVISVMGQVLAALIANLVPEYAEENLKIAAEDTSFVLVLPLALGVLLGIFIVNRFLKNRLKRVCIRLGLLSAGLGFLGLSLAPLSKKILSTAHLFNGPLYFESVLGISSLAGFFSLLLGIATALTLIPALTFAQQNIPRNLRGRAFGIHATITAFLIIGLVIPLGGLAELIGVPAILGTFALAAFAVLLGSYKLL